MATDVRVYFVTARHGRSKNSGEAYGLVELVSVEGSKAQTQTVFCDPSVAMRAEQNFKPLDQVNPILETRLSGRGPRAELIELAVVK